MNTRVVGFNPPNFGFPMPFRSWVMSRHATHRRTDRQTDRQPRAVYNAPSDMGAGHNKRNSHRVCKGSPVKHQTSPALAVWRGTARFKSEVKEWGNEWMNDLIWLPCDQKQAESQFSPTYASTYSTKKITKKTKTKRWAVRSLWWMKFNILSVTKSKFRERVPKYKR